MPPKTPSKTDESGLNPNILTLIHLMATADTFKPDMNAMTVATGIKHATNVPRKINSIIEPYGFEFKSNKLVAKDGVEDPEAKKVVPESNNDEDTIAKTPNKAVAKKGPKTPPSKKQPVATTSNKKRKVDDVKREDDEVNEPAKIKKKGQINPARNQTKMEDMGQVKENESQVRIGSEENFKFEDYIQSDMTE